LQIGELAELVVQDVPLYSSVAADKDDGVAAPAKATYRLFDYLLQLFYNLAYLQHSYLDPLPKLFHYILELNFDLLVYQVDFLHKAIAAVCVPPPPASAIAGLIVAGTVVQLEPSYC
jgi:hypothetical protein